MLPLSWGKRCWATFKLLKSGGKPPHSKVVLVAVLLLGLASHVMAQSADAKLDGFFKAYLEESFQMRPLDATMLGDHRFDNLMDDLSPKARAGWLTQTRKTLAALSKEVKYSELSRAAQIDFDILKDELIRNIWLTENTHPFEEDPRVFGSYISDSVYSVLTQSTLPKETNVVNAIARMRQIPRVIATAQETLNHPSRPVLETSIRQNKGAIAFYEKELFELVGESPHAAELKTVAAPIVEALKKYQHFLETDLMARADGDWRLGKKKFARKLELVLDAGLTADQVMAAAESEFDRVQRDMYVVARQLWSRYFPKAVLPPDDVPGRRATIAQVIRAVSQEHGKPEDLVTDARATVGRIKKFISENDILRLPEPDRCQVTEMPEFKRGNSLAYLESALPLDPAGPSTYAISPPPADWDAARVRSFLEEYNAHMLQVLTIHEAYPGHYVQLEYSNRSHSLIRRILQSGVFVEGWAVYTEQMMLDQGYGDRDLALRMNQLKFYLRAVANTILDHKMHCTSMTDEEALKFLTEGAFQSEGEAKLKIIRSKQSSTQLSTYFVGRMAHYRMRTEIQREMGDKFELGRYHEAVLDHGSIPMKFLPELVRTRMAQPR